MKLSALFLMSFLFVFNASAETITCEAVGRGDVKRLIATRNPHSHEPQWFDTVVEKKGFFSRNQKYSLSPLYFKGEKMTLMEFEGSPQKNKLLLNFVGVGSLHKKPQIVEVVFDKGIASERKQKMRCQADRAVGFVDHCSQSKYGEPNQALLYASKVRNANLVDMILSCEPDVNFMDSLGCSPLMYAADHLCGTGKYDQFRDFAYNNRIFDALIAAGSFVDIADPVTLATPLIKASQDRDLHGVKSFADLDADIDAQDIYGNTALMYAVMRGDEKLVELLIGYFPDLEIRNSLGQTAVDIAKMGHHLNIELLLQRPSKVLTFSGDSSGGCAVGDTSIQLGHVSVIELKATAAKMFLLEVPELGLELMANPGEILSARIRPAKAGAYKYTCGFHGGNRSSTGYLTVQ